MWAWDRIGDCLPEGCELPSKIHLVSGQLLSKGYVISHQQSTADSCEVVVSGHIDALKALNLKGSWERHVDEAHPASGFTEDHSTVWVFNYETDKVLGEALLSLSGSRFCESALFVPERGH
jgi:hypothetical protein